METIETKAIENTKKKKLLAQIEAGLRDVKKMCEGKSPEKTFRQMLNEQ